MYKAIKRTVDFLLSLIGIIIFSPLFLIVSLLIKINDGGPILFKQKRTGKNGKIFTMYKFRSMTIENDVKKYEEEDHMTAIGKIIRVTSIDELPQLFNILKGDMSLIGPRPWVPAYYDNMTESQRLRFSVLPGITGLAQVKGRNSISIQKKIQYDLEYVKNYSFIEDIKIIGLTIKTVFKKEQACNKKSTIKEELDELNRMNKKSKK